MAYKSLIDYYGGGMVKPSDGFQLGGVVSSFGIKSGAQSERRELKKKIEEDQRAREKGGWKSFVGGLAGTAIGGFLGRPDWGASIGSSLGQYFQEKDYKPVDVSGGKYALDIKEEVGKGQQEHKKGGVGRIGMAGLMGYMGGGEGGMYQSILGAPKKMLSKGAGTAAVGTAAAGAGAGASAVVAPTSAGTSAIVAPTSAGMTFPASIGPEPTLFGSGLTGSGTGDTLAQGLADWALPESSVVSEAASDLYGPLSSLINPAVADQDIPMAGGWGTTVTGGGSPASYAYGSQPSQTQMAGGVPYGDAGTGGGVMSGIFNMLSPSLSMPRVGPYQGGGLVDYMMPQGYQGGGQVTAPLAGYGTATDPLQALSQMGMQDVADDPRLKDYMEDLPKFEMGYKQNIGDIMAGGQSSYKDIAEQTRTRKTGSGFQSSGAGTAGVASARKGIQSGVETGRRREVESFQGDLLSAIDRIQSEAGITFGDQQTYGTGLIGVGETYDPSDTGPEGWPSRGAYDSWVQSGSDPNTASNYGWQATVPGATPGYKA